MHLPAAGTDSPLESVLLRLAVALVDVGDEPAIRSIAVDGLSSAGFTAVFLPLDADEPPSTRTQFALEHQRPSFTGGRAREVVLPIDDDEVLVISGGDVGPSHARSLAMFAALVRKAISDARRAIRTRTLLADAEELVAVARAVASSTDLGATLTLVCDTLARLLGMERAFIALHFEEHGYLVGHAASRALGAVVHDVRIPLDHPTSVVARVARTGEPAYIEDVWANSTAKASPFVDALSERAMAALPLRSHDRLEAVLVLDDTRRPREMPASFRVRAEGMASHAALVVSSARLVASLRTTLEHLDRARAEASAHARLVTLGELAATIAHEIRNPLAVIFNAVALLQSDRADGGALLAVVEEEARRMDRVVHDLLLLAKPRALDLRPGSLRSVLREAVAVALRSPHIPTTVRAMVEIGDDVPDVPMDVTLACQAFANLVRNAAEAMPRGGRVAVRALRADDGAGVSIEVQDEGIGISPQLLSNVFDPFYTTKSYGSGLGLPLVRRIVTEHGGHITIESNAGSGTSVMIWWPIRSYQHNPEPDHGRSSGCPCSSR